MRNCANIVGVLLATVFISATGWAQSSGNTAITEVKTEVRVIKPEVRYQFSRTVGRGRLVRAQVGKAGQVERVWRLVTANGKTTRTLVSEERTPATPTVYLMGREGFAQSRGSYVRGTVKEMKASAYDPSPRTIGRGATGRTRMGIPAGFGTVAVDPRVIPLGTRVFVEGYGYAIAADTGSAIRGNRIDLCFPKRSTALRFGRQTVRVHILRAR